jgi:hypothetical protein
MVRDCIDDLLTSLDTRQAGAATVWAGLRTVAKSCECFIRGRSSVGTENKSVGVVGGEESVAVGVVKTRGEEASAEEKVGIEAIADYFLNYHKTKEREGPAEGEESEVMADDEELYSQERKLPAVEQVCVEVMRRCGHHMSHDQPDVQLVVMDTLQHCMKALSGDKVY